MTLFRWQITVARLLPKRERLRRRVKELQRENAQLRMKLGIVHAEAELPPWTHVQKEAWGQGAKLDLSVR